MKIDSVTKIGKYDVPVVNAKYLSLVTFSSGEHGSREKGHFVFWSTVLKKAKHGLSGKRRKVIIGRARPYLSPGNRVDRMQQELKEARTKDDRAAYRYLWESMAEKGGNIKCVRPSTLKEIQLWIDTHYESDARFITAISVVGENIDKKELGRRLNLGKEKVGGQNCHKPHRKKS